MEKLAGAIWNQVKSLEDIEKKKEVIYNILKKKEYISFSLRKEKIGRTRKVDSLILEVDEVRYILPNITPKLLTENLNKSRDIFFKNIGWFTLRSVPNHLLDELYLELKKIDVINKETLKKEIGLFLKEKIYPISRITHLFETSFSKNDEFREYIDIIEESIELFVLGYYKSAIAILIPCIEGISRKIYGLPIKKNERAFEKAISKSLEEWNNHIYGYSYWISKEIKEDLYYYLDEISSMQATFLDFMNNFLYLNSDTYHEKYPYLELNRHGISHGVFKEYGTESNWLILFSILDFLTTISSETRLRDISETYESRNSLFLMQDLHKIKRDISKIKTKNKYNKTIRMNRIFLADLNKILIEIKKTKSYEESYNQELYLIDKLASEVEKIIRIDYRFHYIKKVDYEKKIVRLVHGDPNIHIFSNKKEKDLMILLIKGSKVKRDQLDNTLFKFEVDLEAGHVK